MLIGLIASIVLIVVAKCFKCALKKAKNMAKRIEHAEKIRFEQAAILSNSYA